MSIKRRPDRANRWQARYRDPAGVEHARLFDRKVDAQMWLDGIRGDLVKGTYLDPKAGRQLFGDYVAEWVAAQVQHRPSTVDVLGRHLRNHVLPVFGARPLASVRRSEVQAWVTGLSGHLAPGTVAFIYGYVATIFKAAMVDGRLAVSPCVGIHLPEVEVRQVVPMRTESVLALVEAIPEPYPALVLLVAGTGLRQGETFGLTLENLDFLRREVRVVQQLQPIGGVPTLVAPKTRASLRTVPVPDVVLEAVAAHLSRNPVGDSGLVFSDRQGRPLRRTRFGEVWRAAVVRAELAPGTHFHELRHYYASLLIHSGASVKVVQARLGHKSAVETLDIYGHLWPDSEESTRAAVQDVLGRPADQVRTSGGG